MTLAVGLALAATEGILRGWDRPKKHDLAGSSDPEMNEPDARLGWVWKGPFTRATAPSGRPLTLAFDEHHDRVRSLDDREDRTKPRRSSGGGGRAATRTSSTSS